MTSRRALHFRRDSHQMGTGLMFPGPAHGYSANLGVGHTGWFPRSRSEWIVVRSRLRFAAGVCVLAAGLLMGGGAVAVADPGLGGSAPNGDDGTNDSVQGGPTAGGPVGNVTDTVRETVQGVTGTPASGAQPKPAAFHGRDKHGGLGPATRPAAFHRRDKPQDRDKPEDRGGRHGHRGPEGRRGPRHRGSQSGRRGSERGGTGYQCGGTGY